MSMFSHKNSKTSKNMNGSALVIALIVLAILGALGLASLEVADMNIMIAANDRDSKESFFHADSGANIGNEYLEVALESGNSTYYGGDANDWVNATIHEFNATAPGVLTFYPDGSQVTYVRCGVLERGILEGSAFQIAAGYEGLGKGAAGGGTFTTFLIRGHREGKRNSVSEVDLAWRHLN